MKKGKSSFLGVFASRKLTIFIVVFIVISAILGTIIPQEDFVSLESIKREYPSFLYAIFIRIELFRIYHSLWFKGLFFLLLINIIASTIVNLPKVLREIKPPERIPDPENFQNYPFSRLLSLPNGPPIEKMEEKITTDFKELGFKIKRREEKRVLLFGVRGRLGRFGFLISHLGFILLLSGVFISSRYALRGRISLVEGETTSKMVSSDGKDISLPFSVGLDWAKASYYQNGMIKEWEARAFITINGEKTKEKTVRTNHPLSFRGFNLIIDEFTEKAETKIKGYTLDISGLEGENRRTYHITKFGEELEYPEEGLKVVPLRFIPDFVMSGTTPFSRSQELRNPALEIEIIPKTGEITKLWVLAKHPELNRLPGLPVTFSLRVNKKELARVGFELVKDPGVKIVALGGGVISFGLFLILLFPPASVVALIFKKGKQTLLFIGGGFHRNYFFFEKRMEQLMESLRVRL